MSENPEKMGLSTIYTLSSGPLREKIVGWQEIIIEKRAVPEPSRRIRLGVA